MKQMKISKFDESPSEWSIFCLHLSSFPGTQGGFGASVDGHPVGGAKIFGTVWGASWILVMLKSWGPPEASHDSTGHGPMLDDWWNCRIVDVWWVLRLSYVKHDWRWL